MKFEKLLSNNGLFFEDIKIITPNIFNDNRGYFYESWNKKLFNLNIQYSNFCQENHSYSTKNVLRGLHYQKSPHSQSKLVECLVGKVYDVVVDLRKKSPTFLSWGGIELSERNHKQIFIPEGFAHGFYTLSNNAHLIYKVNNYWHPDSEKTIIWNDPKISINWMELAGEPIISEKDASGKNIDKLFPEDFY